MKCGQTGKRQKQYPDTGTSKKRQPKRSSDGLEKHLAEVTRSGKHYIITFSDGRVTQGRNRPDALVMAADMWACLDDRDPSHYYARWDADDRISVVSLPPSDDLSLGSA